MKALGTTPIPTLHGGKPADLLQMPDPPCGLFVIAENLVELCDAIVELHPEMQATSEPVRQWAAEIVALPDDYPLWSVKCLDKPRIMKDKTGQQVVSPPLHGLYESHPLWCMLWFRSGTVANSQRAATYQQLQAQCLVAWWQLGCAPQGLATLRRVYATSLLLRKLHQPDHGHALDRFTGQTASVQILHARLQQLHETGEPSLQHGYGAFADVISAAFDLPGGSVFRTVNRSGGHGRTGGDRLNPNRLFSNHAAFWRYVIDGEAILEDDWPRMGVEAQVPSTDLEGALTDDGLEPSEFAAPEIAWIDTTDLYDPNAELGELPPIAALFAAARARARHQLMAVQSLRTRSSRIRIPQLVRILKVLDSCYIDSQRRLATARTQAEKNNASLLSETLLLTAISIVTGTPFEHVRKLPRFTSIETLPADYRLSFVPSRGVWLRPYRPPPRNPLTDRYHGQSIETVPRIVLSDIWGVGAMLPDADDTTWFNHRLKTYEKFFHEAIKPLLARAGVEPHWRQTAAMGKLIPSWFRGLEEGNHLAVALIFDLDDRLANTQRYYTVYDRERLNARYTGTMEALWEALLGNGFTPNDAGLFRLRTRRALPSRLVGDDWTPSTASVKTLVTTLRQSLAEMPVDRHNWITRHNQFTAWTALMLAVFTGFRSVRTPIPNLQLVDRNTGFMSLQEKDRSDGSHARIVWVPETVRTQITEYCKHLSDLRKHLGDAWPGTLTVPATKFRDRSRFDTASFELALDRTLFFIDGEPIGQWSPVEFTGHRFKQQLDAIASDCWPVANAGRHLLRSWLTNKGCADTVINAHLGHWSYGEEPWGPFSTFSPHQYRQEIQGHLKSLWNALDFTVVSHHK